METGFEEIRNGIESLVDSGCEFGFADLRGMLEPPYADYGYGISLCQRLDSGIIDAISQGPTQEYLDHYRSINLKLEEQAGAIAGFMERYAPSFAVNPTFHDRVLDEKYRKTLRAPFSHKMAATRAGLGWIGKCDLFVSIKSGPRVRLATVLTALPLEQLFEPVTESRCGGCEACVKACPAGAPSGIEWKAGKDRDEFFNPFKCRDMCLALTRQRIGEEISICGICVSVCPRGKR